MKKQLIRLWHLVANSGQCSVCGYWFDDWNGGVCAACG
jgi:predicted amidophosphoribosyltransferase